MQPMAAWKHSERTIARMLGVVQAGNNDKTHADCVGGRGHLVVEVKHQHSGSLPGWVRQALIKIRECAGARKLGLLVLHTEGERHGDSLVVMTLQDFADWYVSPTAANLEPGDQVAYIPRHACGDITHHDVELGFVVKVHPGGEHVSVRYWRHGHPGELRTVGNSEVTPIGQLVRYESVLPAVAAAALEAIQKGGS